MVVIRGGVVGTMDRPLVMYHANCWDGFCAAWIARHALGEIEAMPVQYGQDPPVDVRGRELYILDFSYPRTAMRKILSQAKFVCVLDHHKTAEKELAGLVDELVQRPDLIQSMPGVILPLIHFDMGKSGGRLAWEYFRNGPKDCQSRLQADFPGARLQQPPWLVTYTEDRDLWRWKLDWSREINAWLRSWSLDFGLWDRFAIVEPGCEAWDMRVDAGSAILRREEQIIGDHVRNAREVDMDGHMILAVNATVLFSEIAGRLAEGRPFGACYFDRQDGKRQWSLRSTDGGIDVSEIATKHGGGGHRNAAGFEQDCN